MRRSMVVGSSVGIGLALLAGVSFAGPDEDLAAINSVREMEAAIIGEADLASLEKIFASDVESLPPGEPGVEGVDAVRQWLAAVLEQFELQMVYTSSEVEVLGDRAIERYSGVLTMTPKAGGEALVQQAKGMHIYQRGEDGGWKITHDVWNYDAPTTE